MKENNSVENSKQCDFIYYCSDMKITDMSMTHDNIFLKNICSFRSNL